MRYNTGARQSSDIIPNLGNQGSAATRYNYRSRQPRNIKPLLGNLTIIIAGLGSIGISPHFLMVLPKRKKSKIFQTGFTNTIFGDHRFRRSEGEGRRPYKENIKNLKKINFPAPIRDGVR